MARTTHRTPRTARLAHRAAPCARSGYSSGGGVGSAPGGSAAGGGAGGGAGGAAGKLDWQVTTDLGCSGGARRVELTPQQLAALMAQFKADRFPNNETREKLARDLGMSARSVQVWFQNRRQRDPGHVRKPQHKPVIGRLAIDDALPLVTESEKQRVARSVAQLAPTPTTTARSPARWKGPGPPGGATAHFAGLLGLALRAPGSALRAREERSSLEGPKDRQRGRLRGRQRCSLEAKVADSAPLHTQARRPCTRPCSRHR